MPVTAVSFATDYAGAAAGVPLACNFDTNGVNASEIFLATLAVGGLEFVNVLLSDYTVNTVSPGVFTVTPDLTYAAGITVRVFRWLAYDQPFDFTNNGLLNPERVEAMGNRMVMLVQQLRGELGLDVAAVTLPPGAALVLPTTTFDDATDRGNATPEFLGQIGVQLDTGAFYRGSTIAGGGWTFHSASGGGTVPNGGTGLSSLTPWALLAGGTTSTGAMQQVSGLGTAGQLLRSAGAGALPTWATIATGGDVVGPATSFDSAIPFFDGTTGKLLKTEQGSNPAFTPQINLGTISNLTPRPLNITQAWSNAGLTGEVLRISAENTNSALGSLLTNWRLNGSNVLQVMRDGEIRALDGSATYPVYSFIGSSSVGMYRHTATGEIRFSIGADLVMIGNGEVRFDVPIKPDNDNSEDVGSAVLRWRNIYFGGTITGNGSLLTALNGSAISTGTVAADRLGSGGAAGRFLRYDNTWVAIAGGGDMLAANNLSDLVSAPTALTNLGGTTVGKAIFALTNPSAVTFIRMNADNTVTARSAANFLTDLGAGTMAVQNANAVAITGGTITISASVPSGAIISVTNSSATDARCYDATASGAGGIGFFGVATGAGATGCYGSNTTLAGFGVIGSSQVSGGVGMRAAADHASAIAFQMSNVGGFVASHTFAGTAARAIVWRDAAGTVVLSGDTFTGDVTGTLNSSGATALTIAAAAVTLAKMANLAQDQFIGRTTASTGVPETATITAAARTVLDDTTVGAMVDTLGGASSTGTGGLARGTSPTFTTSVIAGSTTLAVFNTVATTVNALGAATTINIGAATCVFNVGADFDIVWNGRGQVDMIADGQLRLLNAAGNGFTSLNIGPATSSFPSLRNTGPVLNIKNGDGTADAAITVLHATVGTGGTTTGTILLKGGTSGTVTVTVAAAAGTWTLTLPTTDGDAGQFLTTDGNGATSWSGVPASAITAGVLGGNITLGESTGQIILDPTLSADGTWSGIMQAGTAGATLAFGDLVYFQASDSRWELTDADAEATSGPLLLGMCVLAAAADGDPTNILLYGKIRADAAFPALTIGAPAYVGTTAGDIQVAQPSGTDDVIRVVGHAVTADVLLFNPSQDWMVHV